MKNIKVSLVDNDYMVHTRTNFFVNEKTDAFMKFIQEITDGFVPGETAHLEIEGVENGPVTFAISRREN
jgi:hypothetical protein